MDYLKLKISPTATQNCPNKFWKIEQTILDQNIVIFNNIDILFSKYLKKYFPTCIGCHRKTAVFYYFQLGIEICTCTHSRKALCRDHCIIQFSMHYELNRFYSNANRGLSNGTDSVAVVLFARPMGFSLM